MVSALLLLSIYFFVRFPTGMQEGNKVCVAVKAFSEVLRLYDVTIALWGLHVNS